LLTCTDGTKYIVIKTTRRAPGSDGFESPTYRLGDGQHLEPTGEPNQFRAMRPGGVVVKLLD